MVIAGQPEHEQQHGYHHDTKVKPEAATALVEILMMGARMPETCWVVNKRQYNKLEKLLHLVGDLFECVMLHGLTNFKSIYFCLSFLFIYLLIIHSFIHLLSY